MKNYRTAASDEGLRLPHSGVILGHLADALRLKAGLRDALGDSRYKTAQRYFDGERVEPDAVDRTLDCLVATAIPGGMALPPESLAKDSLQTFLAGGMKFHARRWDTIVARTNSLCFPVHERKDLPIPALRLLALDVGLRWGAWINLQILRGVSANATPWWLEPNAIGTLIETLGRGEDRVSFEELAARTGVSTLTLLAWRNGTALPTADHVSALAKALSGQPHQRQQREFVLRLVVGVLDLRRRLSEVCGRERIDDLVAGMTRTAEIIHQTWMQARAAGGMHDKDLAPRLWNVVFFGGRCPVGAALCEMLSVRAALKPEVAADFIALTNDWTERIHHWMKVLGTVPDEIKHLRTVNGALSDDDAARLVQVAVDAMLRTSSFDLGPTAEGYVYRVSLPPHLKAINRGVQAEVALSLDDLDSALEHSRAAVRHAQHSPVAHFKLGAVLGVLGIRRADVAMMEEGALECRLAYQLDPSFGNARNEVAIILSNMRRHEEAEHAFADAEPFHGTHARHWFARGGNYVALDRYDKARSACEKAIELTVDGAHVEAMAQLAAVLMKLGHEGKARRLGRKVHHLTGTDPCEHLDEVLDIWKGNPF